jgi:hypothetical protein
VVVAAVAVAAAARAIRVAAGVIRITAGTGGGRLTRALALVRVLVAGTRRATGIRAAATVRAAPETAARADPAHPTDRPDPVGPLARALRAGGAAMGRATEVTAPTRPRSSKVATAAPYSGLPARSRDRSPTSGGAWAVAWPGAARPDLAVPAGLGALAVPEAPAVLVGQVGPVVRADPGDLTALPAHGSRGQEAGPGLAPTGSESSARVTGGAAGRGRRRSPSPAERSSSSSSACLAPTSTCTSRRRSRPR